MFLLFDTGGTTTRLALGSGGRLLKNAQMPTGADLPSHINLFVRTAKKLIGRNKIKAVVGGAPGPLNRQKTKIINAPNLPRWNHKPLALILRREFGVPAYLENDADLAGLGEAVFGAGKNYKIVAYLTIGTGVGGSRIVDKKIDANAWGFEPGHQLICEETLENLISGTAFAKRYQKPALQIKNKKAWDGAAYQLSIGINNSIVHWSPEVVVLGGSMILGKPSISLSKTAQYLKKNNKIFVKLPPLKKSKLSGQATLYGGLAILKSR